MVHVAAIRKASVLALWLLSLGTAPVFAQSKADADLFDPVAVVNGIHIDRGDCTKFEQQETAVWVEASGKGTCMRYYAAGLKPAAGPNDIAALWLNGDVLGAKGKDASKRQKGFGPAFMVTQQKRLSERFGVPAIFLGRPGTYGSAGKHRTMRGRPIEAALVNAAIDALKKRYGIQAWSLGGHSGGGTLVAEMLARRRDVRCAVLSSGASAYRAYLEARGLARPGEPLTRFDPYTSLDRIAQDPNRRIFMIGDPREKNVPFSSQQHYFEGLVARKHAAWLLPLEKSTDARNHDLVDFGETAMAMCAAGAATGRIIAALQAMPDQGPRVTN